TVISRFVPRMRFAWKKFHWSPAFDWFWAASARWYWANVISLDDSPARSVATTVSTTGVMVTIFSQKLLSIPEESAEEVVATVFVGVLIGAILCERTRAGRPVSREADSKVTLRRRSSGRAGGG